MDYPNTNTESLKNKHLNKKDRFTFEFWLKDGFTPYRVAKILGSSINTILNEIKRGTTTQIIQGKKQEIYLADIGSAIYQKNRHHSRTSYKRLSSSVFLHFTVNKMNEESWSSGACFGNAMETGTFKHSEMVYTKTLYNYIDPGLLPIKMQIYLSSFVET